MIQSQREPLIHSLLGNGGEGVALTLKNGLVVGSEIAKLDAAAETSRSADYTLDVNMLLCFRRYEFNPNVGPGLQLHGYVDGYSILRQIVRATLQYTLSLFHRCKKRDRDIHAKAWCAAYAIPEIDVRRCHPVVSFFSSGRTHNVTWVTCYLLVGNR